MRMSIVAITAGVMLAGGGSVAAQGGSGAARQFTGIKMADMTARTPEQTVTVMVGPEALRVVDPGAKKDVKTFPYSGLKVTHSVSNMPPASAGTPEQAQVQRGQMPTYMGKGERNWLTLESDTDQATLRVSSKVYNELKAALQSHGVTIEERK